MSTAQDGGAAAASSPYGGGGAGGKFRKRPFRRPATPYDRPPTGLRGNDNKGNWLTKLVVDPASKLISYGANRFFAPLFRKRLPAPPPHPTQELNNDVSDGPPAADPNVSQNGAQEPARGEDIRSVKSSGSNGISDLEKLLKQKTFSRSEIDHLTELLRSKAGEAPIMDDGNQNRVSASDFERHPQSASVPLDKRRYDGDGSHAIVSTPMVNSKVLKDDLASPAELAKAYMGSRVTKISPSILGIRGQVGGQVGREDAGMLSNSFASESPIISLTARTSVGLGAPGNGFITPRPRGRSAIYSMSRSPYSRSHPTKFHGSATNHNGYAGATTSSSSFSPVENDKQLETKPMTLKRRSSALDDEIRSLGPIRRIRQKSNLLSPRIPRAADEGGVDSHSIVASSKQKFLLNGEPKQASKTAGKSADNGAPSTSYAHVPPKSSEVAAKILQHLETMTPKEKSSESRFVARTEKSHFKLTSEMLSGQALKSMEDLGSSKLLLDFHDGHKSKDSSNATLSNAGDSLLQDKGKVKENRPRVSFAAMDSPHPVIKNDASISLESPPVTAEASDIDLKSGVSQPPQKKRAFRMSAEEVSFELDDDVCSNGLESRSLSEKKGPLETQHTESKLPHNEERKPVKTSIVPERKSPSGLTVGMASELSSSSTVSVREENTASPALEKPTAAAQSTVEPLSIAGFDKPKEVNNTPSLFGFESKVADKFSPLPSESSGRISEAKPETSSSLVDFPSTTRSLWKVPDSEKADQNPPKADTVPSAASNGPVFSTPSFGLFPAASDGTNQIPKSVPNLFNPSTSTEDSAPASTGNSIFGSATIPSVFGGPTFKFGAAADSSTAVSAAPTTTNPVGGDLKTKSEVDPSSGSSSSSLSNITAFGSMSSGNNTLGVGSFTANNLQAPLSSTSSSFGNSSSATPVSSFFGAPQAFNPITTFGFTSTSSSVSAPVVPSNGPTSVSNSSTVASMSGSAPSIFNFGFSTPSSSASPVGSIGGPTPPLFGASPVPASGISTSGFSSGATSSIFNFGASSSSSSSAIISSSTALSASLVPASGISTSGFSSVTASSVFNFGASSSSSSSAVTSSTTAPVVFGWQNPNPSMFASSSPSTGFSFGASTSSTSSTPSSPAPAIFSSTVAPTTTPGFQFTSSSASPAPFGNHPSSGFLPPSPMNAEDSMAEDTVQSGAPSVPQFGQASASPSPAGGFMFGSPAPLQPGAFQFGGQQNNQAATPPNPSPFQGSNSFNGGGSFSLGSGGGDKSGRKFLKIGNRNKNRKR